MLFGDCQNYFVHHYIPLSQYGYSSIINVIKICASGFAMRTETYIAGVVTMGTVSTCWWLGVGICQCMDLSMANGIDVSMYVLFATADVLVIKVTLAAADGLFTVPAITMCHECCYVSWVDFRLTQQLQIASHAGGYWVNFVVDTGLYSVLATADGLLSLVNSAFAVSL